MSMGHFEHGAIEHKDYTTSWFHMDARTTQLSLAYTAELWEVIKSCFWFEPQSFDLICNIV